MRIRGGGGDKGFFGLFLKFKNFKKEKKPFIGIF